MKASHQTQGYTLIEVMIALAIFAILGMISVGVLSHAIETKKRLSNTIEPIQAVLLSETLITQDFAQSVNRTLLTESLKRVPAFSGAPDVVSFTRGGFMLTNTSNSKESTLRHITLRCEGDMLIRESWPGIDKFDATPPQTQVLFQGIRGCHFSFLDAEKTWTDAFESAKTPFPLAVKLELNLKSLGPLSLIFKLPGEGI